MTDIHNADHRALLEELAEERDCRDAYQPGSDWYLDHDRRMVTLEQSIERLVDMHKRERHDH